MVAVPGTISPQTGQAETQILYWPAIALAVAVFLCLQIKPLSMLHPIVYIGLSALAGVVFQL